MTDRQSLAGKVRGTVARRTRKRLRRAALDGLLFCEKKTAKAANGAVTITCEKPDKCPALVDDQGNAVEKECRLAIWFFGPEDAPNNLLEACYCIYKPVKATCKLGDDGCTGTCPPLKDAAGKEFEGICASVMMPEGRDKTITKCVCVYQPKRQ